MKKAFLFTGQGSQYLKMGYDLYQNNNYAKEMFDKLDLSFDIKKVCFEDEELLKNTKFSQVSIFVISMILTELLKERNIEADYCAGLSLGEYTALCYANVFSIDDGIKILEKRGDLMIQALKNTNSGMMAVLSIDKSIIKECCEKATAYGICEIANYNSPNQIVVTGENKALDEFKKLCLESGGKSIIPLNVFGAFHSSLLKSISKEYTEYLDNFTFNNPRIPVYYNCTGNSKDVNIKEVLGKHLYSPVLFEQIINNMIDDGVEEFFEVGIGSSITSIVRSIARERKIKVVINHIETLDDINGIGG
ncbi:MAG: ACP S-malonyltransferase [Bacilli bacterium]|nr:ACP S-malonyltransferase [Bacilli bacterium]MDD4809226.1 ACP S-malonyltransferase [Bacilli bacterium]